MGFDVRRNLQSGYTVLEVCYGKRNVRNAALSGGQKQASNTPVTTTAPTNKTQQEILDVVKEQVGIDLTKYREQGHWETSDSQFVNIDWNSIPRTEQQRLMNLTTRYPNSNNRIGLADTSGWTKMVYFSNRVRPSAR